MMTDVRIVFGTWGRKLMLVAAAAMLVVVVGCGGETIENPVEGMTDDQKDVNSLVGGVSDYSSTLSRLREIFTKDGAPKSSDLKKYQDNAFSINGPINVSGSSATFTVDVMNYDTGATTTSNWTAVKEEGKWLLSEAPVP